LAPLTAAHEIVAPVVVIALVVGAAGALQVVVVAVVNEVVVPNALVPLVQTDCTEQS